MEESSSFIKRAARIFNSGQSRVLVLTGNIHDLHGTTGSTGGYEPIVEHIVASWSLPDFIIVLYELNAPVRFMGNDAARKVKDAWVRWRTGLAPDDLAIQRMLSGRKADAEMARVAEAFDDLIRQSAQNPTLALEFLRQLCLCSRSLVGGSKVLSEDILVVVEGADMLLPDAPLSQLSEADRRRVAVCQDWFSGPGFLLASDSVVLLAESRSLIHHRVARLPQLAELEIPSPGAAARLDFIRRFAADQPEIPRAAMEASAELLSKWTAGLSLQALLQLLKAARHEGRVPGVAEVSAKVESFMAGQLGEDVVEFKRPSHRLDDCVGFGRLKSFLRSELMPRLAASGADSIPGAAVCGPVGGGKTYLFEAMAAELDMVVLSLKNIRSQWFGQTDVILERLRRLLMALDKTLIFVDEADTQFGGVGADAHETERRLTGKIQSMMSDTQMRGRVVWLLVTARIHRLSPDLRRPGRVGDLIIPILDPDGEDRKEFVRWAVKGVCDAELSGEALAELCTLTAGYSVAGYSALRSELKAKLKAAGGPLPWSRVSSVVRDILPPPISDVRRFQTLQALVNCTRRSLLPNPDATDSERVLWSEELRVLESRGIG